MLSAQKKVLAIVIGGLAVSALSGPAFGHGAIENPRARQWECNNQGGMWNPDSMKSAACRAALENSPAGANAFVNWNGYTGFAKPPHAVAQTDVRDGMLCSGSNPDLAGFNQPRSDWTSTVIQPDSQGQVGMTYYYTARHTPSFIEFYINKKDVDITKKALGWNDVELLKRFDIAPGDPSVRHTVNVTIPADRVGKAIIFTRWQRMDPVGEGFYNCSDVDIKARDGSEAPAGGGEEENSTQSGWTEKGNFITQAHSPAVGEKVRFRLMGGAGGDNLIDINLPITSENVDNHRWVVELGQLLNLEHSNELQIGQKQPDGTIRFNDERPLSNQVFVSNSLYGYAIETVSNAEAPVITLDRYTVSPVATSSATYSYAVTGSSNKEGVNWQWKQVAGDPGITLSTANQATTQIRVAGGVKGGAKATFELTGTRANGYSGKATLKVNVIAPEVTPTGPASITADKGAKFTARANFDYNKGQVNYRWSLLKNGSEVSGIDQNGNVNSGLKAGDYQVNGITASARLPAVPA